MNSKLQTLSNGCTIVYHDQVFDLELDGQIIAKNCIKYNCKYHFIVIRQINKLIVFSTTIKKHDGIRILEKLAECDYMSDTARISVFYKTTYFIDFECNISTM